MDFHISYASPFVTSDMVSNAFNQSFGNVVSYIDEIDSHNAFGYHKVFDIRCFMQDSLIHLVQQIKLNGFARLYYTHNGVSNFLLVI
jgi:hypothetical protein